MASSDLPTIIPREILFGNPVRTNPLVSPDGTMLAYRAPLGSVMNVWVGAIGGEGYRPVTSDTERGISHYFWAADSRHILYIKDAAGDENWRLYSVDIESGAVRDLTPFEGVQVRPVDRNKHYPNELLVAINLESRENHDVYHLDLTTGALRLAAKNPGNVVEWVPDRHFEVRGAMAVRPDGGFELLIRESPAAPWEIRAAWRAEDTFNSGPIGFSKDGRSIYLIDSRDANAGRLVRLEIATGKIEVIAEDPQYDVGDVVVHPETYEIQMVAFTRARSEWLVLDQSIAPAIEAIRALHHGDFSLVNRDDADNVWVIDFIADDGPTVNYVFDRRSRAGSFLFHDRPDLAKHTLATMKPISYTSRDGMTIHGYVTFPPGLERRALPMVVNVHGGPWTRNVWGYHSEAQWLANRGYICMQVNYRGSTGYGKRHLNAGNREWGGRMHDDIVDAVRLAIDEGWADPAKVAIYGGSYGGYEALVGATFTPDLFRCAIDIVGPSNLVTFIETIPPYWAPMIEQFRQRVGDPETERKFLESRSPLFFVDRIGIPMLIAQGANDPRVNQAESERIVEAMRRGGITHEYMLFPDEGHGFVRPENRLRFYAAAERFLARWLGGRYEESHDPTEEMLHA